MSHLGRKHIEALEPSFELKKIERWLSETEEARKIIQHGSSVPLPALEGIEPIMGSLGKGYSLTVKDISAIYILLNSCGQIKRFMVKKETIAPIVCSYAHSLYELTGLIQEIERCIRHGQISDAASSELVKIRKKIAVVEERVKKKLDTVLQKNRSYLQENIVSIRNGRYVLPVKKEYRKSIRGTVLDESASGQTVFIEPSDISDLQTELSELQIEESREESRVLSYLTGLIEAEQHELTMNLETIGYYDFIFAKAKFAHAIGGRSVTLNNEGIVDIKGGRHPLLGTKTIPLDFQIGLDYRALIITGPNTGGKTVTLKTVGLLTIMVQSGLLVPVEQGSMFSLFRNVAADIGDGQSIEQSLSTFSSHIKNIIRILKVADSSTLILLDELATGTDPGEGIGLSIAILEELSKRKSTVIATTHFNEIKNFAEVTPGFQNARMEFDVDTLQPLYRLHIGEAGNSYAFLIALKLGMNPSIIERSKQITYRETIPSQNRIAAVLPTKVGNELKKVKLAEKSEHQKTLKIGDSVWIHSLKRHGIVYELEDARGNVGVMIQKEKLKINHKRLSLYIGREQLYPDNYDMDIVFESKEDHKKRKKMSRKHVEGLTIQHLPEEL